MGARKRIATVGLVVSAMNVITYQSNKLKTFLMTKRNLSETVILMKMVAVVLVMKRIETEIIITETVVQQRK